VARSSRSFSYDRPTIGVTLAYMTLAASLGLGMVMAELRKRMHLSGTVTSLHTAFFGWGLLVAGLLGFWIVARIRRDLLLRLALCGSAAGALVFISGERLAVTLLGALIIGVSGAMITMTIPTILADHHGDGYADALAATNAFPSLVGVIFPITMGVALSRHWGWRGVFAPFVVTFAALALAVLGPAAQRPGAAVTTARIPVTDLLRRRTTRNRWLMLVVAITVEFATNSWVVAYLREIGDISSGVATGLFSVLAAGMFVARLAYPAITRGRPAHQVEGWGFVVSAIGILLVWGGPSPVLRALGLLVQGLGLAVLYPLGVARLFEVTDADTESLGALAALASGAAITIGPMLVGTLADLVGLRWAFLAMPALAAIGAFVNLRDRERFPLHRSAARLPVDCPL
jgi:predicted MFS family arabinose efflux permease